MGKKRVKPAEPRDPAPRKPVSVKLPQAQKIEDKPPQSISLLLNGKPVKTQAGQTIWKAAFDNGITIPGLCYHPDFCAKGNCRVCVVEVKGKRNLVASCSTQAEDGLEIMTETDRVKKARNMNLELIFAEHIEKCPTCVWRLNCKLLSFADKYKLEIKKFRDRKSRRKIYQFANTVEIDGTQCIDCRNCVDACSQLQKIDYLEIEGKGAGQEIVPTKDPKIDCIYCGQCAVHCPVGSAQEQVDFPKVEAVIKNSRKIAVAQIAPSIRASIGEEFGLPHGKIVIGQLVAALKELGFDYVFDVNFGADVTTMVEAEELLSRVAHNEPMPMFTSCCPAWVKWVEFYRPDLIPNLTTSRSPQIHNGGIIKTYWAQKAGIKPKDVVTVSVMPCTSKKFEAGREEMFLDGLKPVDHVITTRELAWLIKSKGIDLHKLKSVPADNPLGEYSGAAAIYGASGGVMESALRTAQYFACQGKSAKLCEQRLDFTQVRGMQGVKEASVDVAGTNVRVAVVNGIGNIRPVLDRLSDFDYIEVMACPGGCIGGGGQPIPTTPEIRKKRAEALYSHDKSLKIRKAHENQGVLEALNWLTERGHLAHKVLHTKYKKRKKGD
jgi:NADH-quinone oxidoreductase subunit G/NADP-reducing hydrogenase subunit HndD